MKIFIFVSIVLNLTYAGVDPYLWLEKSNDQRVEQWIKSQNKKTVKKLTSNFSNKLEKAAAEIYSNTKEIPPGRTYGEYYYSVLQNDKYKNGLLIRIPLNEISKLDNPQSWEAMLDLDKYSRKVGKNLFFNTKWGGEGFFTCLSPSRLDHCIFYLSEGGKDSSYIIEFDLIKLESKKNGFSFNPSKSAVAYASENELYFADALTKEGKNELELPGILRLHIRNEDLRESKILYKAKKSDLTLRIAPFTDGDQSYVMLEHWEDDWINIAHYVVTKEKVFSVGVNKKAGLKFHGKLKGEMFFSNKVPFKHQSKKMPRNSVFSISIEDIFIGRVERLSFIWNAPLVRISNVIANSESLYIFHDANVQTEVLRYNLISNNLTKLKLPKMSNISGFSGIKSNDGLLLNMQNSLISKTLIEYNGKTNKTQKVYESKNWFNPSKYLIKQLWTKSKDGTKVPYYITHKKGVKLNGKNPTLMTAYGGFSGIELPTYSPIIGRLWLEGGGIFVLANIRGGGEFGSDWYEGGRLENKQNSFDDFLAVAENLITRKFTNPDHLGAFGSSNGGLLMGAVFTQRPDLFSAIYCGFPLLDMKRFHKLLVGQAWISEYGNPDTTDWNFIKKYSPYHNIDTAKQYPEILLNTSTKDDRVHPGHARKMNQKLIDKGFSTFYLELENGGHSGGSTVKEKSFNTSMMYSYFWSKLR